MARTKDAVLAPEQKELMEKEYLDFVKPSTYGNKANPSSCNSLYDDVENLRLVTGYIEDDKEIINKVNKKAFWTAVFIVVLCWLIYVVISWAIHLGNWIVSLF